MTGVEQVQSYRVSCPDYDRTEVYKRCFEAQKISRVPKMSEKLAEWKKLMMGTQKTKQVGTEKNS